MSFRRTLYSVLLYLVLPVVILRLLWRSRANPAYRKRIPERFGFVSIKKNRPIIWVHAVSVGETNAAQPLIDHLINEYPNHRILITNTTPTGSQRVKTLFDNLVEHCYFPYDLPDVVNRFLRRIKPQILIVVETEIWPNLFSACQRNNIPIGLVNARLSEKSTDAYLKIKNLISETLSAVNFIAVRSKADADSFARLAATESQISVAGNIKFDIEPDQTLIEKGLAWKKAWGEDRKVLVAASTHQGEDELILNLHDELQKHYPGLIVVLVPRHPERFESVYELSKLHAKEKHIRVVRHSLSAPYNDDPDVDIIVGDSMGEMQSWFATADIVIMGGSLVKVGGHNPIEAIVQGKPVLSGPYMFNFRDIVPELAASGMLTVCDNTASLTAKSIELLSLDKTSLNKKAQRIMNKHKGATVRLLKQIKSVIH